MRWNYESDLMLRLCLEAGESHKAIARRLNCKADNVNARRRKLGLHTGKAWSDDMNAALAHGYGRYPDDMVATTMGKSVDAMHTHAIRIGLRKRKVAA